jgi:Tfp pilus assembly protein PilO
MNDPSFRRAGKTWHVDAVAVALCFLMTLGLYYGGLVPLMRDRDATLARQDELEKRRQNASSLAASVARVRSQLHGVREAIDGTPLKLQPSRLVNNRLAELTELANAQGLLIEHIEPSPARAAGRYEIVPLRMAGVGRFPTCVVFLHKLREGFPDTGIAGFQLSGNPSAPGTGRFELELHWFAMPSRANEMTTDAR